jgi:calcium permeable stress-gated cation channel
MGFAFLGLCLFYIAYRYNLLFVNTSNIDTKGYVYAKALNHTLVGCYLCVICMIGLFGIQYAPAPLALMVVFLILMILYHISLNAAVKPLMYYLPRSLEAEEESLLQNAEGLFRHDGAHGSTVGQKTGMGNAEEVNEKHEQSQRKVSFFKKWLRPDIYCNYAAMRRLVPHDFAEIRYSPEVERDAYQHPSVTNITPLLWVPRDEMGVSRQECAHTNKVTPMTDEAATFDAKGKVVWDQDYMDGRAPIYEEKIYY